MTVQRRSWVWLWLALASLIGVLTSEAIRWGTFNDDIPVVFQRVEVLNSPIAPGGEVIVRIWRDKSRDDCPVYSQRTAVNQDGVAYDLPDAQWRGGLPDTPYLDYAYPTLATMPDGPYELRVHLTYNCPKITFEIEQPSALFRVERAAVQGD